MELVGREERKRVNTKSHREAVAKYAQWLENGKTYRKTVREPAWRQSEKQYLGEHWDGNAVQDSSADLITVNMSFSTVMTIVPFVTGEEPSFIVEPFTQGAPTMLRNARLQQAWLNRIWRNKQVGAQEALSDAAIDWLVLGDGILKASYQIRSTLEAGGDPTQDNTVADLFVDRVSPWDFWIEPTAPSFAQARWVCHRVVATKDEVESDPRYRNTKNISYQSHPYDHDDQRVRQQEGENVSEARWANLYEFYDTAEKVMVTFVDGSDVPLRWVEGIVPPFVQLANYPIPNSPYHFGELEQIWSLQQELNKTRSQMATHRRRNTAKVFIKKDALNEEAKQALQSPIVGEFVPVDGDQPLDDLIKAASFPNLSADTYNVSEIHRQDILEITGVSEYQRGVLPNVRRTATEASIIEGASNAKTRFKLRQVERAARGIGILLLAFAKEIFPLTTEDEMRLFITGSDADGIIRADPDLAPDEVGQSDVGGVLTPDVFEGEYQVDVEVGSTELRSPTVREQKFREMALALIQVAATLQQLGIQLNLRKPLELWFEAAGVADVEGMFGNLGEGGGVPPEIQSVLDQALQGGAADSVPRGVGPGPQPGLQGLPSNPTAANTGALNPSDSPFAPSAAS